MGLVTVHWLWAHALGAMERTNNRQALNTHASRPDRGADKLRLPTRGGGPLRTGAESASSRRRLQRLWIIRDAGASRVLTREFFGINWVFITLVQVSDSGSISSS